LATVSGSTEVGRARIRHSRYGKKSPRSSSTEDRPRHWVGRERNDRSFRSCMSGGSCLMFSISASTRRIKVSCSSPGHVLSDRVA
jgi:hypothetical protein